MSVDIWGVTVRTSRGDVSVNIHEDFGTLNVRVTKELVEESDLEELGNVIAHAMIAVRKTKGTLLIENSNATKVYPT